MKRYLMGIGLLVLLAGVPAGHAAPAAAPTCFEVPGIYNCIDGQFKTYWQANGGLPVFGYPITAERAERNSDTQRAYSTQWFERNRLEAHPENQPPYHVLLGRLGAELLARQGRGFEGVPAGTTPSGRCKDFDVGGKRAVVCDPFFSYWESHGLEFDGQRGTSYGESLALFGLPLTYPKKETNPNGDTVVTQWFERARFEDHGAKGVLLGLLGREVRTATATSPIIPLVDGDSSFLLGGVQGGAWRSASEAAAALRGGETYRLFTGQGAAGTSAGAKPELAGAPCDDETFVVPLQPKPAARSNVFAIGGAWNPLPRVATAASTDSEVYRAAIAEVIKANGIASPEVRLTAVLRVDLEGNGVDEVVISAARYEAESPQPSVRAGDYSLVVLRQVVNGQVKTTLLGGEFYPRASDFAAPSVYSIAGVLDLNGDGQLEIIMDSAYYEGAGTAVFDVIGGEPTLVIGAGCGA